MVIGHDQAVFRNEGSCATGKPQSPHARFVEPRFVGSKPICLLEVVSWRKIKRPHLACVELAGFYCLDTLGVLVGCGVHHRSDGGGATAEDKHRRHNKDEGSFHQCFEHGDTSWKVSEWVE